MEVGPKATDSGDLTTDGPTRGDCLALLANMCCRLSRLNLLNEPQTLRQTTQATATGGTYHQEKGVDTGRGGEGGTHVPTLILLSYWRPKPNGARQELDADKRGQKFAYFRIARQSLLPTSLHSPSYSPPHLFSLVRTFVLGVHEGVSSPSFLAAGAAAIANQRECSKGPQNSFAKSRGAIFPHTCCRPFL